jgi:hypothetical protein
MKYLNSRGTMSRAERAEYRERWTLTNWAELTNSKVSKKDRKMRTKKMHLVDFQEALNNEYGIPKDPEAAVKALADGSVKATENPDAVDEGVIVETYSITVKDKESDTIHYQAKEQPFAWRKVASLAGVFANEGATLSDDAVNFLGQALADADDSKDQPIGKAVRSIVDIYNSNTRANAKGADYQRILNLKAPMTEETKGKRIESMIAMFASINRVSLDVAREKMKAAGLI